MRWFVLLYVNNLYTYPRIRVLDLTHSIKLVTRIAHCMWESKINFT